MWPGGARDHRYPRLAFDAVHGVVRETSGVELFVVKGKFKPWADVPVELRISEENLKNCRGASQPGWVERETAVLNQILDNPNRCQAGRDRGYFWPCAVRPQPGETFCGHHGGLTGAEFHVRERELKPESLKYLVRMMKFNAHIRKIERARRTPY